MSSPSAPVYSVDASAFIDLGKQYPQEFFPDLWERLDTLVSERRWIMTEKAVPEVHDREPAAWIGAHPAMVIGVDAAQEQQDTRIMATHGDLVDTTRTREDADPFVIALALAQKQTLLGSSLLHVPVVLTHEKPRAAPCARPKIPDVCGHYEVEWCDLFGFFRKEGWRFRLEVTP